MKKIALVLFNVDLKILNINEYDSIVGIDRGSLLLAKNNIKMDYAIGDFDSVNNIEFELIKKYAKSLIKLNPIKDDTDTAHAIELFKNDEITIFGGIKGKRIEHFYAILLELVKKSNIRLIDENSLIEVMDNNDYIIKDNYKYISIFGVIDSIISLSGFKYNLDNYKLSRFSSLGVSNEIISMPKINLIEGKLLLIYSNED